MSGRDRRQAAYDDESFDDDGFSRSARRSASSGSRRIASAPIALMFFKGSGAVDQSI
ncbi:hypothetical protein HMPREF0591_0446 [Mycobacterium parascrofulaceum ATCC BAA-614]|uniref:Uncharacterized protein n=1 Tax=Mycobacterium parascrofulaceum ATCC BAA-614 TaxID=525368 RepID=D5P2Q2_9MYCO|nr:hypothetical protein HMPREF0591_0446 [Mycobacterium parascrofulaceum ATCC BAA-614]